MRQVPVEPIGKDFDFNDSGTLSDNSMVEVGTKNSGNCDLKLNLKAVLSAGSTGNMTHGRLAPVPSIA